MGIFKDFCKIKRQFLCQENIFGYKTALANQLYASYCILGMDRYFTDQFHYSTKLVFLAWHVCGLLSPVAFLLEYVLFLDKNDLILFLHVLFLILSFVYVRIGIPFLFFKYKANFKQMLDELDSEIWNKSKKVLKLDNAIDIKSTAMNNVLLYSVLQMAFALIGTLDALIFYDENKLKNNSYFIIPLPKIEEYGNLWIFLSVNGFAIFAIIVFGVEVIVLFGIPFILAVICHNEAALICHTLKQHSTILYSRVEKKINSNGMSLILENDDIKSFRKVLVIAVVRYQRMIRIIKYFKGFYITLNLITLLSIFVFSVSHIYAILTMNEAYMLRFKEICISISTLYAMYFLCKIGDILDELADTISFEVYSMPWYCSTAIRKDVYLLLCQSQHKVDLKAAKVFPILLSSFQRLISSIYSTVNMLRRVTS